MRRKRVMVIGPTNCGKTALAHALNDDDRPVRKTQDIIYGKNTMDVPGSYIENAWMYKHLIAAAQDASHILMLVDASKRAEVYPPGFAKIFRCPVTGVISKIDLARKNEEFCIKQLRRIGVSEPYYSIDSLTGTGLNALKQYLFEDRQV